jgi:membrane-associated phospholipid phosphatase
MSGIESWGVSVILWLQSYRTPATDLAFRLITFLGEEQFYLLLLPVIYWCVDKRMGMRLAALVLLSNTANVMLKLAFAWPRPPAPPVRHLVYEDSFGFPSGHTQNSTVAFGFLAWWIRRRWASAAAAALVVAVGLSRLYLGVHFPHDVLGGLAFGLLVLAVSALAVPSLEETWATWPAAVRYPVALAVPLALLAVWPLKDTAGSLGALAGLALGEMAELELVRFVPAGSLGKRLLRFLLGVVLVAALYFGLKLVPLEAILWRFARYGAVGLAASLVAPWLFVRLGLAEAEPGLAPAAQPV